jgi:hypothetical protein
LLLFQQDLHPDSIFMACFSKDWTTLQHEYLTLNNFPRHKRQAATTIKQIMMYLLDMVHTVWLTRNANSSSTYAYWLDQPTNQLKTFLKRMRPTVRVSTQQASNLRTQFRPID